MPHTFLHHVITIGSRVVLQAAVDNKVCDRVIVNDEHKSDDQAKYHSG